MSVYVMGLIWRHYPNGGGEFLTALALADHAKDDGTDIFPSVAHLAEKTQQSPRTIQYQLKAMQASGWLVKVKQGGKKGNDTTRYRIPIERIPQGLVGRVQTLHPSEGGATDGGEGCNLEQEGCKPAQVGVQLIADKPSVTITKNLTISNTSEGGKAPSAVSQCFQAYKDGLKARYDVDYPSSAKVNGQLANMVARLGAEGALATVRYFLTREDAWIVRRRHALDVLVKDPERWNVEMQAAAKPRTENQAPAMASIELVREDETVVFQANGRPGDPDKIAGYCAQKWEGEIRRKKVKYLDVHLPGQEKRRYSIAELLEHGGSA